MRLMPLTSTFYSEEIETKRSNITYPYHIARKWSWDLLPGRLAPEAMPFTPALYCHIPGESPQ